MPITVSKPFLKMNVSHNTRINWKSPLATHVNYENNCTNMYTYLFNLTYMTLLRC